MRYLVTCDLLDDRASPPICLWPLASQVSKDSSGFWGTNNRVGVLQGFTVREFQQQYNMKIEPGTKRVMDIVVCWVTEEE